MDSRSNARCPSVRIETDDGQVLYIDPWSQVLDAEPHDADVVFVTHDDMDHYDPDAIDAVADAETTRPSTSPATPTSSTTTRISPPTWFIPPIGGHFTMDRHEAARFTESVGPELVLPVHYDTFEQIETDADAFEQEVETDGWSVQLF